ncbi:GDYXXLXY domain-containing protein [Exiguobacterium qingdaonense]|uniref:GDYXXLXY domain-containing protein n=1 Tax=Exiguobacterium qingdaonense TaxID=2751251 RepID=UPI001BE66C59|nr:GDYXXLXY domain-containing protein [Exiguobacterium qingdaonense]
MRRISKWTIPVIQVFIAILFVILVYAVSWVGETYTFEGTSYEPYDPYFGDSIYLEYDALKGRHDVDTGTVYVSFQQGDDGFATIDRIESNPFFGGVRANYFDRVVYIEEMNVYRVSQDEVEAVEGEQSFTVQVDIAPWGMLRMYDLKSK